MILIDADRLREDLETLIDKNPELIDEWFAGCITDVIDEQPVQAIIPSNSNIRAKLKIWEQMLRVEGVGSKGLVREEIEKELKRLDGSAESI